MKKVAHLKEGQILDIMSRLDFFDAFSREELETLVDVHSSLFVYEQGEYVINEGGMGKAFFILLSGTVSVTKGDDAVPITRIFPGDFFGEIAFITGSTRITGVIANDTVIVMVVDHKLLDKLRSDIREKIKDKVIEKLIFRLKKTNEMLVSVVQ
ncbi:MAG: cyclic nucleotide-binding domain-containing protein [Desulfobacteraceae bacterium]